MMVGTHDQLVAEYLKRYQRLVQQQDLEQIRSLQSQGLYHVVYPT